MTEHDSSYKLQVIQHFKSDSPTTVEVIESVATGATDVCGTLPGGGEVPL